MHMGGPFWARKDEHAWSIPKGEYEPGEDPHEVAAREFEEELGSRTAGRPGTRSRALPGRAANRCRRGRGLADFDAASCVSNTFEVQWPPGSGRMQAFPEVDRAEWFGLAEARIKLVKGQVVFLDRLAALLTVSEREPPWLRAALVVKLTALLMMCRWSPGPLLNTSLRVVEQRSDAVLVTGWWMSPASACRSSSKWHPVPNIPAAAALMTGRTSRSANPTGRGALVDCRYWTDPETPTDPRTLMSDNPTAGWPADNDAGITQPPAIPPQPPNTCAAFGRRAPANHRHLRRSCRTASVLPAAGPSRQPLTARLR